MTAQTRLDFSRLEQIQRRIVFERNILGKEERHVGIVVVFDQPILSTERMFRRRQEGVPKYTAHRRFLRLARGTHVNEISERA